MLGAQISGSNVGKHNVFQRCQAQMLKTTMFFHDVKLAMLVNISFLVIEDKFESRKSGDKGLVGQSENKVYGLNEKVTKSCQKPNLPLNRLTAVLKKIFKDRETSHDPSMESSSKKMKRIGKGEYSYEKQMIYFALMVYICKGVVGKQK